jgi:transcriptional regulator with XRE-family HTH domain
MSFTQFVEPITFTDKPTRHTPTPLALFVRNRLAELGLKQSEFCKLTGFDQGLMSRIQNSMITNLSLESVLRLALGLSTPPQDIFNLIDRSDLHELVVRSYASE